MSPAAPQQPAPSKGVPRKRKAPTAPTRFSARQRGAAADGTALSNDNQGQLIRVGGEFIRVKGEVPTEPPQEPSRHSQGVLEYATSSTLLLYCFLCCSLQKPCHGSLARPLQRATQHPCCARCVLPQTPPSAPPLPPRHLAVAAPKTSHPIRARRVLAPRRARWARWTLCFVWQPLMNCVH